MVYRTEDAEWVDPWGGKQRAERIVEVAKVEKTEETWHWDSGYPGVESDEPFYTDGAHKYRNIPTIDYYGGGHYYRDFDKTHWHARVSGPILDLFGEPITDLAAWGKSRE